MKRSEFEALKREFGPFGPQEYPEVYEALILLESAEARIKVLTADLDKESGIRHRIHEELNAIKGEQQPLAFTQEDEISNMHATGLYLRAWPPAPAAPEKAVKLPMPYTVVVKHNELYFEDSETGDNYDVSDVKSALDAAGIKYEVKP